MHACGIHICSAHVQVAAEKLLLRAALEDTANARFVLLSETCVPLYPATVVWAQLVGEPRSRLNACAQPGDEDGRMTYRWPSVLHACPRKKSHAGGSPGIKPLIRSVPGTGMALHACHTRVHACVRSSLCIAEEVLCRRGLFEWYKEGSCKSSSVRACRWADAMARPTLSKEHWRKSNQWFALTARHAQLVLADTVVAEAFSKCAHTPHSPLPGCFRPQVLVVRVLLCVRSAICRCPNSLWPRLSWVPELTQVEVLSIHIMHGS